MPYLSGDERLIAAVEDKEDIHSMVGRTMFQKEELTNEEFKAQFKSLRVAAKSIVFGLLYGRGSSAIAREVEKAGLFCTADEAQDFINDFMNKFPLVERLIDSTHAEITEQGYVETLWGRRELFYTYSTTDEGVIAGQKRQGFNFKIQGYVADLLRQALINLDNYKRTSGIPFKVILTVHDSIMLETPAAYAEEVSEVVIPQCMTYNAKAPKLGFTIRTDTDVCTRWEEKLYLQDFIDLGLPKDYGLMYCKLDNTGFPVPRPEEEDFMDRLYSAT